MRYRPTPDFVDKAQALMASGEAVTTELPSVLADIERIGVQGFPGDLKSVWASPLEDQIYALSGKQLVLFVVPDEDPEGEYLLLLDVAERHPHPSSRPVYAARDPKTNASVDPRRNASIDPRRNASIDPRRNASIDPRRNASLDPRRNPSLDSRVNRSLDPRRNRTLSPRSNPSFGGPFVYSRDFKREGFMVRATEQVVLFFDMTSKRVGFGVATCTSGYNLFDYHAKWTGYLVPNGQGGYNKFSQSGKWEGIVV